MRRALPPCVAKDVGGYVETAVRWGSAKKAEKLRELRRTMRASLKGSPVTDCARLAGCMEDVYSQLWKSRLAPIARRRPEAS
jgi:predicted O-linked N-acetylglucosamine transferase (SPINDLY family)